MEPNKIKINITEDNVSIEGIDDGIDETMVTSMFQRMKKVVDEKTKIAHERKRINQKFDSKIVQLEQQYLKLEKAIMSLVGPKRYAEMKSKYNKELAEEKERLSNSNKTAPTKHNV